MEIFIGPAKIQKAGTHTRYRKKPETKRVTRVDANGKKRKFDETKVVLVAEDVVNPIRYKSLIVAQSPEQLEEFVNANNIVGIPTKEGNVFQVSNNMRKRAIRSGATPATVKQLAEMAERIDNDE